MCQVGTPPLTATPANKTMLPQRCQRVAPPTYPPTRNIHTRSTCQVIKAVLKDPEDTTQLSLLYANVSPDDILLREELDALAAAHPDRLRVWYTGKSEGCWCGCWCGWEGVATHHYPCACA